MKRTLTIVTLLLFQIFYLFGNQSGPILFERIDRNYGLSLSTVYSIYKDGNGYMWFGTRDGLNRFDGYSMKIFKHSVDDKFSINSNEVLSITEDTLGNLWIGTQAGGINILEHNSQRFINVNNSRYLQAIRSSYINSIYKGPDGTMWIGTRDGLYKAKYNIQKNGGFSFEEVSKNVVPLIGTEFVVRNITSSKSGNLLLACEDGFYIYNIEKKQFKNLQDPQLQSMIFTGSYSQSDKILWLTSMEKGLIRVFFDSNEMGHITKTELFNLSQKNYYYIPTNRIESITADKRDNLWVGSRNGLISFNLLNGEKNYFQNLMLDNRSISDNKINCIYSDAEDIVWIGTEYKGVNKIDLNSKPFFHLKNLFEKPLVAEENYVTSITGGEPGKVFIGTDGRGIAYLDIKKPKEPLRIINSQTLPGMRDDIIISLLLDSQADLWIGSNTNAVGRYNTKTGQLKYYDLKGYIFAFANSKLNSVWIGCWNEGLYRIEKETGKITNYRHLPNDSYSLSSNIVLSVFEDKGQTLWVGTKGAGLNVMDNSFNSKGKLRFKKYLNNPKNSKSISNNDVNSIFQAKDGTIWICTASGLNKVLEEADGTRTFENFFNGAGMPSSYIHGILEDKNENLWLSTNKGIIRFNPKNKSYTTYDSNDGLQSDEFRHNAFYKDPSGRLYFGGNNGLNYFYPDSIQSNPYKANLMITSVNVVGEENNSNKFIYSKDAPNNITLKYRDKEISIEFSALHYSVPQKNKYSYRLKGFNDKWQTTDANNRKITYTNLDNGDYVFEVKASNNDEIWNNNPATLYIKVLPPPWKTAWAFLFYAIFIASILILFRKYSLIAVKEKNDLILEHLEREKLDELSKMKLQFFTNVSHELRTPLTLIKSPLDELLQYSKIDEFTKNSLSLIQKNVSRLLQMSNQLLDFRKIDSGRFKLSLTQENIVDLLNDIYKDFIPLAQSRNMEYVFNSTESQIDVWVDKERIKTVFYNLLSNAFKYSKNGSSIMAEVSVVLKEFKPSATFKKNFNIKNSSKIPYILINIIDTGMGIEKHSIKKIFERFYQANEAIPHFGGSGIGLAISREYVELHGGIIVVESRQQEGSCFSIYIPKGKDHYKNEHVIFVSNNINDSVQEIPYPEIDHSTLALSSDTDETKSELPLILIIEDNEELLVYLKNTLSENYRVICAANGNDGYIMAGENNPDLIITDLSMPGMDGIDLCEHLKSELATCHIPIIIITARVSDESNIRGLETGADVYVNKPFNIHILKAQVKSLLDSRQRLKSIMAKELVVQPKDVTVASLDERFLAKLMEVVEENASDQTFGIKELTEKMNMSHSVIFRKIKSITGLTVVDYIRTFRLKKAAIILTKKKLPISEVSFMVGFSDPKYFSKCFQKEFGLSPTEYANKKNPE